MSPIKQEVIIDPPQFEIKIVKQEPNVFYNEEFFNPNTDTSSSYPKTPKLLDDDTSQQTTIPDSSNPNTEDHNLNEDGTSMAGEGPDTLLPESYSPLTTAKCSDARLEQVLTVIGGLAVKWGYFENEIVFLVSKRLEIFFLTVTEATMLGECYIFCLF